MTLAIKITIRYSSPYNSHTNIPLAIGYLVYYNDKLRHITSYIVLHNSEVCAEEFQQPYWFTTVESPIDLMGGTSTSVQTLVVHQRIFPLNKCRYAIVMCFLNSEEKHRGETSMS